MRGILSDFVVASKACDRRSVLEASTPLSAIKPDCTAVVRLCLWPHLQMAHGPQQLLEKEHIVATHTFRPRLVD